MLSKYWLHIDPWLATLAQRQANIGPGSGVCCEGSSGRTARKELDYEPIINGLDMQCLHLAI